MITDNLKSVINKIALEHLKYNSIWNGLQINHISAVNNL